MKRVSKYIIKVFRLKEMYFKSLKIIRNLVEYNDWLHSMLSKIVFDLSNTFNWKITHIPYFLAIQIRNTDVVIDCGANVGKIVKPLIHFKPTIYCFEPNPIAFQQLKENLGISDNIHFVEKAVGVENKTARLFKHVSSIDSEEKELIHSVSASLLSNKPNVDKENYYEIKIIDFLEFIRSINKEILFVKIDIEGAEVELVNALLDHELHNKIKYVFVETHEHTIPDLFNSTVALKNRVKQLNIKNIYFNWT
jgi:FkbM family methyltransferase